MRRIIGTAGAALAVGLVALALSAGSAAAFSTALCKENKEACPAGSLFPAGTVYKGATGFGKDAVFAAKGISVQCASNIAGETSEATAGETKSLVGKITGLEWSNCKVVGTTQACTVKSTFATYKTALNTAGANWGTLRVTREFLGELPGVSIVCGEVINCTYTTLAANLIFEGGVAGLANVRSEGVELSGAGTKCFFSPMFWTASYVLSAPVPVYVTG